MDVCFLGRQTMNGNRHLLFQQTCPSLICWSYVVVGALLWLVQICAALPAKLQ
jgi:hypothetical protein